MILLWYLITGNRKLLLTSNVKWKWIKIYVCMLLYELDNSHLYKISLSNPISINIYRSTSYFGLISDPASEHKNKN